MNKKRWALIGSSAGVLLLAGVSILVVLLQQVKTIPYAEDEDFISDYTYKNQPTMGVGDPYLFTDNGKYYFTGTNDGVSFNLRESTDLKSWKPVGKIFSKDSSGAWGTKEYWQPQVLKGPDGKYYLYYCAHYPSSGFSRIGVAVSDTVDGDYKEVHGKPLFDPGYSVIDPHVFIDDDGQIYLYFSRGVSQNVVGGIKTSQIYVVKMKSMTELADDAEYVQLTTPTQSWETQSTGTRWNEGPDILKHDGRYYLFVSANNFATRAYSIGYATSDSPMGPFTKAEDNPVLTTPQKRISGTGNNSFFYSADGRELFTAYHAHRFPDNPSGNRVLFIDRCGWREDGTFYINGPTITPQPQVSGVSALERVTAEAFTVEASSSEDGYKPENAYNGQIGIHTRLATYEWVPDEGDKEPYWELTFKQPQETDALFLYASPVESRRPASFDVVINGKTVYSEVPAKDSPGEASILKLEETTKVKSVRIVPHDMGDAERMGLADVQLFRIGGDA